MKVALCILALLCVLPASLATITSHTSNIRGFVFNSNAATTPAALIVGRFTGLTTNLVSGTDYTVAVTGSAGAFVITITNIFTGNYTFSDDNGATFYPSNGAGVLTQCMSPDVPAITLDTAAANSNTYTDAGSGRLRLRLRFLENNRYSAIAYRYRGGENNCNSTISSTGNTFQSWSRTSGVAQCNTPFMSYEQDFNDALTRCNYFRDESNPAQTVFNATIVITTTDTGVVIRSVRYARILESSVTIRIAFNTNISTTSGSVSVFGPRITFSAVTQQLWNPSTFTATVTIITSVQWPYQLATFQTSVTPAAPADWSNTALTVVTADPNNDINGVAHNRRSRCFNTSGPTTAGAQPSLAGNICNQYWTVTLQRNAACGGSTQLTLAGTFSIVFNVTCPNYFTGACSATAPFNDAITFSTNSTNYCPQVVTNNNLNTATLLSYSNTGYSVPQTQFVFGTITYFQANVTSPILMNSVGIESISVSPGGTVATPYYFRNFTSAQPWFTATPASGQYSSFALCAGGNFDSSVNVFDNVNPGDSFTKLARFTILWGTCTSTAVGDAPQTTTVTVNLRIRYTNQSTSGAPSLLTLYAKTHRVPVLFEENDGAEASAAVAIAPTEVPVAAAESSSSSAMVVGVIAGVAAATALLVGITVYMLRRGNKNKTEQTNSVQLSSSTSTIQPQ